MPKHQLIADAKLSRIESDIGWARMHGIISFSRDHGNLLIKACIGGEIRESIGYLHDGCTAKSASAYTLKHADPTTMAELVRGYRLAKAAGLLER